VFVCLLVCAFVERGVEGARRGGAKRKRKDEGQVEMGRRCCPTPLSLNSTAPPPLPPTMTADAPTPPSLPDEIMRRHAGKPGAESRALVGVLGAVLDAVRSRGLDPSPAALFAALMAALDGPRALEDPQVS